MSSFTQELGTHGAHNHRATDTSSHQPLCKFIQLDFIQPLHHMMHRPLHQFIASLRDKKEKQWLLNETTSGPHTELWSYRKKAFICVLLPCLHRMWSTCTITFFADWFCSTRLLPSLVWLSGNRHHTHMLCKYARSILNDYDNNTQEGD